MEKTVFVSELGIPKDCRNAKKKFPGKVFDLPNGTHAFHLSWRGNRNPDYPCWGIQIENYLPVSMLASDYETACQASAPAVQEKAWVGNEVIHPNHMEILLNVQNNRPVSLLLKS